MAKVSFTNLKLKVNNDIKEIEFNGQKIEVLQYLPISDKLDLIVATLQSSKENAIFNPVKLDLYFHLNLMYLYTNINFTDKQREDEYKLYDLLTSSGLLDKIVEAIPEEEYNYLCEQVDNLGEDILNFDNSTAGLIKEFIDTLPVQAEKVKAITDSFDPQKYQAVIDFAKAANGGRDIN